MLGSQDRADDSDKWALMILSTSSPHQNTTQTNVHNGCPTYHHTPDKLSRSTQCIPWANMRACWWSLCRRGTMSSMATMAALARGPGFLHPPPSTFLMRSALYTNQSFTFTDVVKSNCVMLTVCHIAQAVSLCTQIQQGFSNSTRYIANCCFTLKDIMLPLTGA